MLRTICKSRTYQLSIQTNQWNKDDDINYAHAVPRRLPAEVLYDAIQRATGSVEPPAGPAGRARAAQLLDSAQDVPGGFLDLFGKPPRESVCECERSSSMMLGPVLNMVNGPVVGEAIKDPNNRIAKLLRHGEGRRQGRRGAVPGRAVPAADAEAELAEGLKALKDGEADYTAAVAEHDKRAAELAAYEKTLDPKQAQWEKDLKTAPVWTVLDVDSAKSAGGATLTKQPDGSILASGTEPVPGDVHADGQGEADRRDGDPAGGAARRQPAGAGAGPGAQRQLRPERVQGRRVRRAGWRSAGRFKPVTLQNAQADFSQESWAVAGAIDGNEATGWAIAPQFGKPHTAVFEFKDPIAFAGGAELTITMVQKFPGKEHNLGKFRLSVTTAKTPISLNGPPAADRPDPEHGAGQADAGAEGRDHAPLPRAGPEYNRLAQRVAEFADAGR